MALRHVDDGDRVILFGKRARAISIEQRLLVPEPIAARVLAPPHDGPVRRRHHGPVETRRVPVGLECQPVALEQAVQGGAGFDVKGLEHEHAIRVKRRATTDLYDVRGRIAEPGGCFDVGFRASKSDRFLGRVARPDAADGNDHGIRALDRRDDRVRIGDVTPCSREMCVLNLQALGIARNTDDHVTAAQSFLDNQAADVAARAIDDEGVGKGARRERPEQAQHDEGGYDEVRSAAFHRCSFLPGESVNNSRP